MRKNILVSAFIIILVALGGLYFIKNRSNDDSGSAAAGDFSLMPTSGTSFVATLSGTSAGETFSAVLKQDKQGNTQYSIDTNGETTDIITTPEAYFTCQAGICYKYPNDSTIGASFNQDDYTYSNESVAQLKDLATYDGQQSCPAGTCDVWTTTEGTNTTQLFINKKDKRISQVVNKNGTDTTTIAYSYQDVTITPPANAQEIPSL